MQTKVMNGVAALFAAGVLVAIGISASGAFNGTTAAAGSGKVESGAVSVTIKDLAFQDGTRTVTPGTTVTWKNLDTTKHTVTATSSSFDSGEKSPGQTYRRTFSTIGKNAYYCTIHPFMKGSITVVARYGSG